MTNGTKITIAIAVIITLSIVVYGKVNNKSKKEENNINSDISQYFNEFENNDIEENVISNELNETVDNTEKNENTIKNEVSDNKTTVIGKEEQESSKENTAISDEQKAIEIAKNEWAISVDSYDYRAELQSDGTYVVRVIGKTDRNEVTRYIVNVKTGVATEVQ
ncbi:MAG: hypothetical protein ACLR4X_01440 [Clostridia bacterium]|nr:unknown [Clostridium sp. CAG:389]